MNRVARQNRVTPLGELIADPARGLVYGNRGCLHDEHGRIRRRYNGKRWISCRLEFKGWRRKALLQPGKFTELFFLDEATAFAAGHRPCALCRRDDYNAFVELWRITNPGVWRADDIDVQLHEERVDPKTRRQRAHRASFADLPDGAFVLDVGVPHLVLGNCLRRWTPGGYTSSERRPSGSKAILLTPPSLLPILRSGWEPVVPLLHPSSGAVRPECSPSSRSTR